MMICDETFYEMRLKGKTPEQIMPVIRGLKREKTRLKNIIEHPNYRLKQLVMSPSEEVQFYMTCDYLERAKQALIEAGGVYIPSATEKRVIDFDDSIPYIKELKLSIGGFFEGYETKDDIIDYHSPLDFRLGFVSINNVPICILMIKIKNKIYKTLISLNIVKELEYLKNLLCSNAFNLFLFSRSKENLVYRIENKQHLDFSKAISAVEANMPGNSYKKIILSKEDLLNKYTDEQLWELAK